MVKFSFKSNKNRISIDVRECKNFFSKMSGLMFRTKSKPLLFIFKSKNKSAIHSFFCVPFIIIWFNRDKIVDFKFVKPFKLYVVPKNKFDQFLEIPINSIYFSRIKKTFGL